MTTPKFPRAYSLPGRALARLLKGEHLTHRSFQIDTSSYRFAHFIFVLHGYGWAVQSVEKVGKTNDPTGRKAVYAEYFFYTNELKKLNEELGERLELFIAAVNTFEQKMRVA